MKWGYSTERILQQSRFYQFIRVKTLIHIIPTVQNGGAETVHPTQRGMAS